jgi:hypothetical protein
MKTSVDLRPPAGSLVGLLLLCMLAGAAAEAQADEQPQQANEPKLVRPDDVERLFEVPKPMSFDEYCRTFGKEYATTGEQLARHKLYTDRLVNSLRSQVAYLLGTRNDFLAISYYSDWTDDERARICPGCYASQSDENEQSQTTSSIGGEDHYQTETRLKPMSELFVGSGQRWSTSGAGAPIRVALPRPDCMNAVRHQYTCNSCYAFSVIAALEYLHCKIHGPIAFSEQFIVDCGSNSGLTGLDGCWGGSNDGAIMFSSRWGIHLRDRWPYVGHEQGCPYSRFSAAATHRLKSSGIIYKSPDLWPSLLQQGTPVIVGVYIAGRNFIEYGGGVVSPPCNRDFGHSMLLVGMGHVNGEPYYKFRNSQGGEWGENGHYYLRTDSRCFLRGGVIPDGFTENESGIVEKY